MKRIGFLFLFFCVGISCFYAQEGYSGRLGLGWGSDYNLMLNTCHGVYLKPCLFLGMGTGLNVPIHRHRLSDRTEIDSKAIPLFLEAQYTPFKSRWTPFVSAQVGGENILSYVYTKQESNPGSTYNFVGLVSSALGLKLRLIDKAALYMCFSAHFRTSAVYSISQQAYSFSMGLEF